MKRFSSLLLAVVQLVTALTLLPSPALAASDLGSYSVTVTRTANGSTVHNLKALAVGTELAVNVTLTRTDIDGESYNCRGLELDINDYGLEYIEGSAQGFPYTVDGTPRDATIGGYQIGGATGIGNLRFFFIFGSQSANANKTLVDKNVSVSARYRVTDPASVRVWAPTPIIYLGAQQATDIVNNEYVISYDANGGMMESDPSGVYSLGEGIALPTPSRPGYRFLGWYADGTAYAESWIVDGDKTFTARWERLSNALVGTVQDENGVPLPNVTVRIVRGLDEFGSTVTDANGHFAITVADGEYNLVAYEPVRDCYKTELVTMRENAPEMTVVMSGGEKSSILINTNAAEFAACVGGLDELADKETPAPGEKLVISLTVTADSRKTTLADQSAYETGKASISALEQAKGQRLSFFDLSLKRTVTGGATPGVTDISQTNGQLLRIILPFDSNGKNNIRVYRAGAGTAESLTASPNDEGEYIVVGNGRVEIIAKRFGAYAIGYNTPSSSGGGGGGGSAGGGGGGGAGGGAGGTVVETKYRVTVADTAHGTVTANTGNAAKGETVTVSAAPENGYRLSNFNVVDNAGRAVAVTQRADGSYTFTMPETDVSIRTTFVKKPMDPKSTGVADWLMTGEHIIYIRGYDSGKIESLANITRAEVAMIFYRLLLNQNVTLTTAFPDVSDNAWYGVAVRTLASLKVILGGTDGLFHPSKQITREEFAAIATRFAKATGGTATFTDVKATSWAYDNIATASDYGWVTGYNGLFRPQDRITRAEVATIVNHMLGRAADEAYVLANRGTLKQFPDLQDSRQWYYFDMVEASNEHEYTLTEGIERWTANS